MEAAHSQWVKDFEKFEKYFDADSSDELLGIMSQHLDAASLKMIRTFIPPKLALFVVADASSLLSMLYRFLKGRHSPVWKFVEAGIVKCWAPAEQLDRDLNGKFAHLAKRLDLPVGVVNAEWEKRIAPHVHVDAVQPPPEVELRLDAIRRRDPEDIDYVGLALTIAADGVFTTDKDIIEDGGVRVLSFDRVIKIVTTYNRGRLATSIQFHCAYTGLILGAIICGLLWEGGKILTSIVSRIPVAVWVGLALAAGGLLLIPQVRTWAARQLGEARNTLTAIWNRVKEALRELIRVWGPTLESISKAQGEARELLKSEPFIERKGARRTAYAPVSAELKKQVLEFVRASKKPIRAADVVRHLYPRVEKCNTTRLRSRIGRILSRTKEIRKVSRGLFAPVIMSV